MAYNPPLGANSLVAHGLSLYLNVHSVEIAVRSKSVVLLLLTNCFVYLPLFVGVYVLVFVRYPLLFVHSFAIILTKMRELDLFCFYCLSDVLLLLMFFALPHGAVG